MLLWGTQRPAIGLEQMPLGGIGHQLQRITAMKRAQTGQPCHQRRYRRIQAVQARIQQGFMTEILGIMHRGAQTVAVFAQTQMFRAYTGGNVLNVIPRAVAESIFGKAQ